MGLCGDRFASDYRGLLIGIDVAMYNTVNSHQESNGIIRRLHAFRGSPTWRRVGAINRLHEESVTYLGGAF